MLDVKREMPVSTSSAPKLMRRAKANRVNLSVTSTELVQKKARPFAWTWHAICG
jgi:hypothetical protein